MIGLLNPHTQELKMFETKEQLFKYITTLENEKMLEDHKHFGMTEWSFVIYSRQHVHELYQQMKKEDLTEGLCEAHAQDLELIEISHGNYKNLTSFPLTQNVDLEALRMDWCRAYCKAHEFYLTEV